MAPNETTSELSMGELIEALGSKLLWILAGGLLAGLIGAGASFLMTPVYTARTVFISPQPQSNSVSTALASLGSLSGLAGAVGGIKSTADQYVALMQSVTVADNIIDQFKLIALYEARFKSDARRILANRVRITVGKKDGLIAVEVDDGEPQRAAEMANAFVEELRRFSNGFALTEAQQRRTFFEGQLRETRDKLSAAQLKVQRSGFNPGAIRSEPKAAAEAYGRTKAEISSAEVRLQTIRRGFAENTPEVQQQLTALNGLRAQLSKLETPLASIGDADYISAYRDFKYEETLFEVYSRQFELAKLDESRESTQLQVVDVATAPERRSKPQRSMITALSAAGGLFIGGIVVVFAVVQARRRRPLAYGNA